MAAQRWDRRFFATTRGQVVALLRRASLTVNDLAAALGLTDNAVRAHLATLERDGLVRQEGVRRGGGKPSFAYVLTPDAELLFPKAYGPILRELLGVLAARLDPADLERALRETGRRLAATLPPAAGDEHARVAAAAALVGDLGGLAEVEQRNDRVLIQGYACPIAEAVPGHPEACALVEALLSEATGLTVRECCDRNGTPRCRFEVVSAPSS
jgi:predicted ArsR family transcriptional regulator